MGHGRVESRASRAARGPLTVWRGIPGETPGTRPHAATRRRHAPTRAAKADALLRLLTELIEAGNLPIDGVGFQAHLQCDCGGYPPQPGCNNASVIAANMARFSDLGLDVWVTELDVAMVPGCTQQMQADVYAAVLGGCLLTPRCDAFMVWGFTDRYTWLDNVTQARTRVRVSCHCSFTPVCSRLLFTSSVRTSGANLPRCGVSAQTCVLRTAKRATASHAAGPAEPPRPAPAPAASAETARPAAHAHVLLE